ncbi:MAG: sigma factor-like helix-turn-helix DNA-binding protein [Anaerolineales bacterium]
MDTAQDERSLLGKISWHYYNDGLTQKEIGERLGLSRLKIVRLLKRARAEGVVEIRIASDIRLNTELARGLEERFQLQEAIVTDSGLRERPLLRRRPLAQPPAGGDRHGAYGLQHPRAYDPPQA